MSTRRPTVLIVDDSQTMRTQTELVLMSTCDVVGTAEHGREAVEKVARLSPDVVLMDVHMPVMNGIEATGRITRDYPGTAVVLVSVDTSLTFVRQAMAAGARDYLEKGASPDEIRTVVENNARVVQDRRNLRGDEAGRPGAGVWAFCGASSGGQTSVLLGMASELSAMGARVAVLDLDAYFGSVAFYLGMGTSRRNLYALQAARKEGSGFSLANYFRPHESGVAYLGPPHDAYEASQLDPEAMMATVREAAAEFDYVLVDLPSGVPEAYFGVLDLARYVFQVGEAGAVGIKNSAILFKILRQLGYESPKLRVILNKDQNGRSADYAASTGLLFDLILPADPAAVEEAFRVGQPVTRSCPRSPLTRGIREYMVRALAMPGRSEPVSSGSICFLKRLVGWDA